MKVSEFIEFLKTQDQDATVQIVKHCSSGCGYYEQGGTASVVDFDPTFDWGGETYAYGGTWEFYETTSGTKTLLLGIHNG